MEDDQVDSPSHDIGTRRGEELAGDDEAGREESGTTETGRPTGKSSARDVTSINPQDPIDGDSPELITP